MDSGWISATASLLSACIVAVTAIAAIAQLRHYRNANDIAVYLRLIEKMDSERFLQARRISKELALRIRNDQQFREQLTNPEYLPDEYQAVADVLRYLEHISVLVTTGNIAEQLILAEYADNFVALWERLGEMVVLRRVAFGPYTGRAFEHLAMRSKDFLDSGKMERFYAKLLSDQRPQR